MQPLISVDHESRQNSYRTEETPAAQVEENTPLLHRFPQNHINDRSPSTTAIVSLLLIVLIAGIFIGIYLLVLQSRSENILPPVDTPLQLVSRQQWDRSAVRPVDSTPLKTSRVLVVQTDSEPCADTASCVTLLQTMQANVTSEDKLLPYNFLISSNGQTYESLGWHRPSQLFAQYPNSLVLAFIGNFTEVAPSKQQLQSANNFFAESVSQNHLEPNYEVIGRSMKHKPKYLFRSLKRLPQWNNVLSE